MIRNWPSVSVGWTLPMSRRRLCLASATSAVNTEQLREQLDRLHKEAEATAAKANSSRLRLIRLSEAADNLHRQVVRSVQTGKENEAGELLYQKKKIMQAMEKSKNRIELLDELLGKLRQVISAKETQLIGNVALDLETGRDDATTNVRLVPPRDEHPNRSAENDDFKPNTQAPDLVEKLQADPQSLDDQHDIGGRNNCEGLFKGNESDVVDGSSTLKQEPSLSRLLQNIDSQLNKIEGELTTVLRYSALISGSKDKVENSKVQLAVEILENVCHIRGRIAMIMQIEVDTR